MRSFCCILIFVCQLITAQEKTHTHSGQAWIGYMTSVPLNEKLSLWNDFHLATDNFLIGRHGLTYHLSRQVAVTGGYAWLFLSTTNSNQLKRQEHRPWGQIMFTSTMPGGWQTQQRFRYDARFRETVAGGAIIDGDYTFNHRLRYMFNIRKTLDGSEFHSKAAFLSLNNEVLINFGSNVTSNNLDQFRVSLLMGKGFDSFVFQLGYMYRFVPQGTPLTYRHYHGVTLWINHNIKTKRHEEDLIRTK